jgi:predicted lipid carrier protein YhbT
MATLVDAFPGRFPSEILSELRRLPVGLLEEVLEAKAYRQAKEMVDAAKTEEAQKRLPKTSLFTLVKTIEIDLVEEWRREHRG